MLAPTINPVNFNGILREGGGGGGECMEQKTISEHCNQLINLAICSIYSKQKHFVGRIFSDCMSAATGLFLADFSDRTAAILDPPSWIFLFSKTSENHQKRLQI